MTQSKRSAKSKIGYCFFALVLGIVLLGVWGFKLKNDVFDAALPDQSITSIRSNTSRIHIVMTVMKHAQPAQRDVFAPLVPEIKSAADDTGRRVQKLKAQFADDKSITTALADIDKLNSELVSAWDQQAALQTPASADQAQKIEAMQAERFDHIRKDCSELNEVFDERSGNQLMRDQAIFSAAWIAVLVLTIFTNVQVKKALTELAMQKAREA